MGMCVGEKSEGRVVASLFSRCRVGRTAVFSPDCARVTEHRQCVQLRRRALTNNSNFKVFIIIVIITIPFIMYIYI